MIERLPWLDGSANPEFPVEVTGGGVERGQTPSGASAA
jgi:hypothetical protein